jgi:hypothetical protein
MPSPEDTVRLRKLVHDLNNALAPVVMAGELLRSVVTEAHAARLLDTLCSSAQHGTELALQIQRLIQGAPDTATPPAAPPAAPAEGAPR